jgi:homoserine/homoserine lactone efflux protein
MTFQTWLLFVVTGLVLCLTPGPAVLFVVSHGLRHGRAASVWANLGILTTNAFYFVLSAAGLGAILLASHEVFTVLRYAGAAYLVYLGVMTFRGSGVPLAVSDTAPAAESISGRKVFLRGVSLQAANPKALIFFVALLPQFIRPDAGNPALQIAILGVTSTVVEFFVLVGYGVLAAAASEKARQPRFARLTNRVSGVMLIAAGTGIGLAGE